MYKSEVIHFTNGVTPTEDIDTYLDMLPLDLNVVIFDKMCGGCIAKCTGLYSSGIFTKVFRQRNFWNVLYNLKFPRLSPDVIPDRFRSTDCKDVGQWLNNYMQVNLSYYGTQCGIQDLDKTLHSGYHLPFPFAMEITTGDIGKMWRYDKILFSWAILSSYLYEYEVSPLKLIRGLPEPPQVVTTCHFIEDTYTFVITLFNGSSCTLVNQSTKRSFNKSLYRWIIPVGLSTLINFYFAVRTKKC